jgi:riboflavin kinase/FMN adenylyltransferase
MRIHRGSFDSISAVSGRHAVSLGTFDGVHRGHQAILRELREVASRSDLAGAIAVTFGFHPRSITSDRGAPPSITNLEERIGLLAATAIDDLVVLDFDEALSRMEYDVFVRDLLVRRLGMTHFVLGHDVHFGRERRGNAISVAALGEAIGFNVSQVASVRDADLAISSTRIREALLAGDLDDAVRWAGHPIPFAGVVQRGRELGRQLGFPTANLMVPSDNIALARGVYVGWALQAKTWIPMVANLGRAPSVDPGGPLRLEAHLLDTRVELYGQHLELALGTRLRPELKFSSKEELSEAIAEDCARARAWIAEAPPFAVPGRLTNLTEPGPA